jgi:hypothetical protein
MTLRLVDKIPIRARLDDHYLNFILPNLQVLLYEHKDTNINWNYKPTPLSELFSTPVKALPTRPYDITTQNLLTTELMNVGLKLKSRYIKKLHNPIDYTIIKKEIFSAPEAKPTRLPYSPLPSRLPGLKRITLKIWDETAVSNKLFFNLC